MEIQPVWTWCVYFVLTKLISCTNSSSTFKHMSVFCLSTWLQLSLETNNLGAMGLHELVRQKWFRQRMVWSLVVQAAINAVDEHPATYINIWIEECLTLFNCVYPSQRIPDCVSINQDVFGPEKKVKMCSCPQNGHLKLKTLTSKASSSRSTCKYHGIKFPMKPNGDRTALWRSFFTNPSNRAHSDWQILKGADVKAQKQIAEHPTRSRISRMASHRLPLPCMSFGGWTVSFLLS